MKTPVGKKGDSFDTLAAAAVGDWTCTPGDEKRRLRGSRGWSDER